MALKPYWSGQIRLSLVSLPVSIYPALSRSRQIPLHEIYRKTGQRVRHMSVVDGEEDFFRIKQKIAALHLRALKIAL